MFTRFNQGMDSMREPWRFLLTMLIVGPAIVVAGLDMLPLDVRFTGLLFLCILLIVRMNWVYAKHNRPLTQNSGERIPENQIRE